MTIWGVSLLQASEVVTAAMLTVAVFLAFGRMLYGPSLPDRVVALDLIGVFAVGIMALYCLAMEQPVLLDAALILALMGFLGTIAFARYVERSIDD